jgi:hypothetical protein
VTLGNLDSNEWISDKIHRNQSNLYVRTKIQPVATIANTHEIKHLSLNLLSRFDVADFRRSLTVFTLD